MKHYGIDIASRRADDLDKKILEYVSQRAGIHVLELAAGEGGQAKRMYETGARVTAVDVTDYSKVYPAEIAFIQSDMCGFVDTLQSELYDSVVLQRALHYLTYGDAKDLLAGLRTKVSGPLFISVTGLDTAIGVAYSARNNIVSQRYGTLDEEGQRTFSLTEPVCLYTANEFCDLLQETGWRASEFWTSAFGNHKAVCG